MQNVKSKLVILNVAAIVPIPLLASIPILNVLYYFALLCWAKGNSLNMEFHVKLKMEKLYLKGSFKEMKSVLRKEKQTRNI